MVADPDLSFAGDSALNGGAAVCVNFARSDARYAGWIASAHRAELSAGQCVPELFLADSELDYLRSLRFERRQTSFLLGRLAAKRAVSRYMGIPSARSIEVKFGVFGQPVVTLASGSVEVSITHGADCGLAVAFSPEHPVGIDLEVATESSTRTLPHVLTPAELRIGEELRWAEPLQLTALWSAREALSKILKCGLAVKPDVLAVSSVESMEPSSAVFRFVNFSQYKCYTTFLGTQVFSIAMPDRSTFEPGFPSEFDSAEAQILTLLERSGPSISTSNNFGR